MLNQVYEQNAHLISQVHSSDLKRCYDTAFYACGFPSDENHIRSSKSLRELHFGAKEGLHYDGLS